VGLTAALVLSGLLGASAAAARGGPGPYPGDYAGKGEGLKVEVRVNDAGDGSLSYAMRTGCANARGKVDLRVAKNGRVDGKRVSAGPHRSIRKVSVRAAPAGGGTVLQGAIRLAVSASGSGSCHAKRPFEARLDKTDALLPRSDEGHYTGSSEDEDGLPISFDIVGETESGRAKITNIAVDVMARCIDLVEFDDFLPRVVHLSGIRGWVDEDGEIYAETLEEVSQSEWNVFGELGNGVARVEVWMDGMFGPDGVPDPLGDFYCENDEPIYTAERA
jgi:hypothetical protein